ncbi:leucyl aminopeptidase family protein [Phenylobacterium immobile]|uniref:leucyl aminopeptidase family protein n=1 Tax=Phenylobacterium immobile TaxID=21 RepID=UPI000AE53367|nr:leucyl aminopeptidase family protein [Phenylobacterium immobile]
MTDPILDTADSATPIHAIGPDKLEAALGALHPLARAMATQAKFEAKAGQALAIPGEDGGVDRILFGLGAKADPWSFRGLPTKLSSGAYRIAEAPADLDTRKAALAFALGTYRFGRYKQAQPGDGPSLLVEDAAMATAVRSIAHACALARDMVNTPANDMGPLQLEAIAREIAQQYGATLTTVVGDALLEENYPAVHAVGRAAVEARSPRMLEIAWGDPTHPLVVIVGKGVVFDTGGLDIKPSAGMRQMKKDMGGAAHALALGRMIMAARLAVRLVVITPVVENAISGDAMRPGDVLASRKGLSIEVGNTDAEGRLILADALTRAAELDPVLTIDLATLTGAARAALGPQLPPFYTDDDGLAADLARHAEDQADHLWRMPLWKGYEDALDSDIADLKNDPDGWAQAGSVTAALFLKRFAPTTGAWIHFDIFAWNPRARPGYLAGGEAQAIRALFALLSERYG